MKGLLCGEINRESKKAVSLVKMAENHPSVSSPFINIYLSVFFQEQH